MVTEPLFTFCVGEERNTYVSRWEEGMLACLLAFGTYIYTITQIKLNYIPKVHMILTVAK